MRLIIHRNVVRLARILKDRDGYWTGTYALPTGLGFNTQQVKKEDVPKSYKDLLDAKWKGGKISIDDENYEILVGLTEAWGEKAAVEYLKALAAQAPVMGRGATQRTQLLAVGEFPLAISYTHTVEWSKSQGTSVDWVNLEPVIIKFDGIMLGAQGRPPECRKALYRLCAFAAVVKNSCRVSAVSLCAMGSNRIRRG